MKKKKSQVSNPHRNGVTPEFRRHLEKSNNKLLDFSDAPDELRLSDRIYKLIEPYMGSEEITILVDCATIAWNECVEEDAEIKGSYSLNNMLLNYSKFRHLIDQMKMRKRLMFQKNYRHIKEVKVYEKGDEYNINVASDFDMKTMVKRLQDFTGNDNDA